MIKKKRAPRINAIETGENIGIEIMSTRKQKRILFLAPYPIGEAPSQRFRFEHYLPRLKERSCTYEFHAFFDRKTWKLLYRTGYYGAKIQGLFSGYWRRLRLLPKVRSFDYVFIHRECTPFGPPFMEWAITKLFHKKVIYDFDDAIWQPDASPAHPWANRLKAHSKVRSICKWAWKVSCGNDYLLDFARRFNEQAIRFPTVVDTKHYHRPAACKKTEAPIVIGWTGSHSTLKYLERLVPAIQAVMVASIHPVYFLVIANQDPQLNISNYRFLPWNKSSEIPDLQQIDIGLMPLPDDSWTRGKCGFKAIQYMALGLPALVSPLPVNMEIVEDGVTGFLCYSEQDWIDRMLLLINDPKLRSNMGRAARAAIEANYSVEACEPAFFRLFNA